MAGQKDVGTETRRDEGLAFDFRRIVGMDPAASWLLGPGLEDFLAGVDHPERAVVPLLIEFRSAEAAEAFRRLKPLGDGEGNGFLLFGRDREGEGVRAGAMVAAAATPERLRALLDDGPPAREFAAAPKRILLGSPVELPEKFLAHYPDFPRSWSDAPGFAVESEVVARDDWPKGTVVIGIIDDGIAFAHARLRSGPDTTRVEAFWEMNLGEEFVRAGIDDLLEGSKVAGQVDEGVVYRRAGLIDHRSGRHKAVAWRAAHGAHVADLAAGADPAEAPRDRPVIAVQLPTPVVARTTGERLDQAVFLGIQYILDRAARLTPEGKPKLPVVINLSLGYIAGPHDGSGPLEAFMDWVSETRPEVRFTLPAGNAQLSRCHAVIDLGKGGPVDFDWVVQPGDRTHSLLQVRLPELWQDGVDRIGMRVETPEGKVLEVSEEVGSHAILTDAAGRVAGLLYHTLDWTAAGYRSVLHLWVKPSERPQPHPGALAPAGVWKLRFTAGADLGGVAHAWVQRDDSLYGYPQRGRQPYFDDPPYRVVDDNGRLVSDDGDPAQAATPSDVKRSALFNAVATGAGVLTAGGYLGRERSVAAYSAGGPNPPAEPDGLTKPDALLPSEGSKALPGILAAGSRSGGRVPMSGTSMAAPQLARFVADRLAAGEAVDRASVAAAARTDPPGAAAPPPPEAAGRVAGMLPGVALEVDRFEP